MSYSNKKGSHVNTAAPKPNNMKINKTILPQ